MAEAKELGDNSLKRAMETQQNRRLVVWISHRSGDRCVGCGTEIAKGMLLQVARETGVRCLTCAGLADLIYLPAGDAALTRRATAFSSRSVTVVRFSRARKRHERQGVLVEEAALDQAKEECVEDAARRETVRTQRRAQDEVIEAKYVAGFTDKILEFFPACPRGEAESIAQHACRKYSGRVGRSHAAKALDEGAITLAVRAYVRHQHTRYDELLGGGLEPFEARPLVADEIEEVLAHWRERSEA